MKRVLLDPEDEHLRNFYYVGKAYAIREVAGRTEYMHKVIMKAGPDVQVDHKNLNPLDNRKDNLRICTSHQNAQNKALQTNNTSGYKGVGWRKSRSKWISSIRVNNQLIHLGSYDSKEQAALMYDIAAKKYFGEFANVNFNLELT